MGAPPPSTPTPTYPYVVAYFDGAPGSSDRECDVRVKRDHGWQTVTVGISEAQVDAARERLVSALTGWYPVVTGRTVSKVDHEGTQPTRPDPELPDRSLFIATDQWRAVSDPA
jgi:hypothetical protein